MVNLHEVMITFFKCLRDFLRLGGIYENNLRDLFLSGSKFL